RHLPPLSPLTGRKKPVAAADTPENELPPLRNLLSLIVFPEYELLELQDEEVLRQTLEEEARAEKEWEEKMKQEKAEYELFMLEFGVQYDSEYKTD
ncbi:hypothetical protein Tco_0816319, partial [Tanacetum coccineum]